MNRSGDVPPARQCTLPTCEDEAVDTDRDGQLCEQHLAELEDVSPPDESGGLDRSDSLGNETETQEGDGADTPEDPLEYGTDDDNKDNRAECGTGIGDAAIREHYREAGDALAPLATVADAPTGAFVGNFGWYTTRPIADVDELEDGWTHYGRAKTLACDYAAIADDARDDADARSLYALTTYAPTTLESARCRRGDDGRGWEHGTNPLPEYGEIEAIAPFADVDLADEYKARPLPDDRRELVEAALDQYRNAFADLMGGDDGVFMLDSVGGAYVMGAPAATRPIAEHYDREDRERLFSELMDRLNEWLADVADSVREDHPGVEGVFEPDYLNNKNRQYKAPLSVHKSIDGVVHPIDVTEPAYDHVPLDAVDDELREATWAWCERFTDTDHTARVDALVTTLWREYADREGVEGWQDALDAWLADERERERVRENKQAALERRRAERGQDLADLETTEHYEDVRDAVQAIDVRDVVRRLCDDYDTDPGRDPPRFNPGYRSSSSGTACFVDRDGYTDLKEGKGGGDALTYVARERRLITDSMETPTGADFWQAVNDLRGLGYDIPEYEPPDEDDDHEPVAVLPNAPVERARTNVWDWRGETDDTLAIDDVRERTVDTIADALTSGDERLVDVLPTGGKSYGAIAAAAREDSPPVSIFTTRGRKEQYGQLAEWCEEHGLTHKTLPSFFETCPAASGEHGDDWKERIRNWYRRGATGQDIHKYAEDALGRPLPCQCDDDGQPVECPYTSAWRFDPDEHPDTGEPYDVLIGHYVHAYNPKVVTGRGAIFDEFSGGAYERALGGHLKGAVSYYLKSRPDVPFDDYTDLIENRQEAQRRADGIVALEGDLEPDGRSVLEDDGAHAAAPLATFTLLAAAENDLGNGLERAPFPDDSGRVGIHHRETDSDRTGGGVRVLTPPDLESASAVVALDGTPTPELWNLTLGTDLYHKPVLDDNDDNDERAEYLQDALGLSIVPTTTWQKPYNSADHVHVGDDTALLEKIADKHGETPGVISTKTALDKYAAEGVIDYDEDTGEVRDGPAERVRWYGDILGSNQFTTKRVGAVIGSNHYGDGYIKKWGAYAGEVVERGGGKGAALSYGDFGDRVLTHMREHDTLQAALRFGRDGNGATVYVHTDTLPEWVPTAGEGEVIRPKSDGERQVLDAVASLERDYWTTTDVADAVTIGARRVRQILDALAERGHVRKGQATDDGRTVEWRDNGLEELPEHVALPDFEADDGSCGNARSRTVYTHISATRPESPSSTSSDPVGEGVATDGGVSIRGDPPPNDAE